MSLLTSYHAIVLITKITSLGYPDSLGWQHFSAPKLRLGIYWAAVVTARAVLPQLMVEMLIGSQAEFEITN